MWKRTICEAAREAKGLAKKEVAAVLKMNPSQYSKIENDKVDLQFFTIEKIAKALKINIVDLVDAEDMFKDVSAYDKPVVEKVQLMDLLEEQEKKGLFSIIDGLVAKQKLKQSLSSALNLAS